jgi:hypothetical protein
MVLLAFLLFLLNMLLLASPAVTDYSAVEGVHAVASDPADSGVHILVGGLTYRNAPTLFQL